MFTAVFGVGGIFGMGRVFLRVFLVGTLVVRLLFVALCTGRCFRRGDGGRCLDRCRDRHVRLVFLRVRLAGDMAVVIMRMVMPVMLIMRAVVFMRMLGTIMVMMLRIGMVMFGVVRMGIVVFCVRAFEVFVILVRLSGLRRIGGGVLDHLALDALATAAAARVAMARTATTVVGAVFGFLFGLAMGALVGLDQRLAIGDRNLVIIGVDFAEGQKTVTIAAIFDEGGLQRRLYARNFGEIDVAAKLLALGGLEIKLFDAIAADHNDPGLFRVGGVDQHFVGHFGTLDGGGRVWRRARNARPGDATVHLIRG
jgi:hypothetical protein